MALAFENELRSGIIEGDSRKDEGSLNNAPWFRWMQPFRLLNKSVQSVRKDRETVRVTVLVKKTNLGFLPATFIAFIDIIYLTITIFPDLFSNQAVSLYTEEKWLWYSILFVLLPEEIPYLPVCRKLHFQNYIEAIVTSAVKNHHLQCWCFGLVINVVAK